jgi:16S rRNA G966 N2-methylase RsmD
MTQVNQNQDDEEILRVDLKPIEKRSKSLLKQEDKLKKALRYVGVKDNYLLDHLDPNFHKELVKKTKEKLED